MVDDPDVALLRALVHQGEEAAAELLALLARAKIAASVHFAPGRGSLRQSLDFRAVADLRGLLPRLDPLKIGHFLQAVEHRLALRVVDLLAAGVIVAALH